MRITLILSMCVAYLIQYFWQQPILQVIVNLLTVGVFLSTLVHAKKFSIILATLLFSSGILLQLSFGSSLYESISGISINLPLLTLLILTPLISIPLRVEGYLDVIVHLLEYLKTNTKKLFFGLCSFLISLSPVFNMGALRMVSDFASPLKLDPYFLGRTYVIGFTPVVFWAPFFSSVATVLYYLDLKYIDYAVVGILFALIHFTLGYLLFRPVLRKMELEQHNQGQKSLTKRDQEFTRQRSKFLRLVMAFFIFILILVSLETITHVSMLILVSIASVLVFLIWLIFSQKFALLKEVMRQYQQKVLQDTNTEILIFLGAGVFGSAISKTDFSTLLQISMEYAAGYSLALLFLFILFIATVCALVGIHQVVVIPLIIMQINFEMFQWNKEAMAFLFIFAWMFSATLSPLNALNIAIGNCVGENRVTVAWKWNGIFLFTSACLGVVYFLLLV